MILLGVILLSIALIIGCAALIMIIWEGPQLKFKHQWPQFLGNIAWTLIVVVIIMAIIAADVWCIVNYEELKEWL